MDPGRRWNTSSEADRTWTKVHHSDVMEVVQVEGEGAGASGPAAQDMDSQRSRSRRAPENQGYRGGAGLGRGVPPKRFEAAGTGPAQTKQLTLRRVGTTDQYRVQEAHTGNDGEGVRKPLLELQRGGPG